MPELPEVEVLVRHLAPLLKNKTIRAVNVRRAKVLLPTSPHQLRRALTGAKFTGVSRRGKFLLFTLRQPQRRESLLLLGHLGMTGRIYLQPANAALPKHAAVVLNLGRQDFIYEDQRYFGRLTLATANLARLGPEPLAAEFTVERFSQALKRSVQPIKVKLLDQSLVAGVGNIYASEALFRAGISPRRSARRLKPEQVRRLWRAVRRVLAEAIACGSTIPLNHGAAVGRDRLFYFGRAANAVDYYAERLRVYDRDGEPCVRCGAAIKRITQAARSTFYCPHCQRQ
ncbi:MAG: bifunctional DNA-formamidopyrimidine glycosylase/DNA-(apurinic or apyrimidinic site) lyase [Verrucomicrobia bacterium]|nr:bifunctional DNA-formamidopyrimidine glycosylase/DNA-(apurinic or apyrimidinic site) lyase [Verrucomicrobiota bacterium]